MSGNWSQISFESVSNKYQSLSTFHNIFSPSSDFDHCLPDTESINEFALGKSTLDEARNFNKSQKPMAVGHWSKEEHRRFIEALQLYDRNWKLIQLHVATRSISQIRSHAQEYFDKLEKNKRKNPTEVRQRKSNLANKAIANNWKLRSRGKLKKGKRTLNYENSIVIETDGKYDEGELKNFVLSNPEDFF